MTRLLACLVLAIVLTALASPRQAVAQAALELDFPMPDGLGKLKDPQGLRTFDPAMRAREFDQGQPGERFPHPGQVPDLGIFYWPVVPVVGATRVGFLNTTDAPVRFTVSAGTQASVHELSGREILTVEVPQGASVTGIVSTGSEDVSVSLDRGAIYLLRPENNRWIFSRM